MADANWSKYDTLFRLKGTNGSTAFQDYFGLMASLVTVGSAQITTSVADPFGGTPGVLSLPGSAYLYNTSYPALSGDFTVGGWFRTTSTAYQVLFSVGDFNSDSSINTMHVRYNTNGQLELTVGSTVVSTVAKPSANTWFEAVVTRQSGVIKLMLNGVSAGTAANTSAFGTHGVAIGDRHGAAGLPWIGQCCDFYIANGDALRWADYTPATSRIAVPYLYGTVRDGAGALCQRTVRAYRRSTGVLSASGLSDAVTGAYSLEVLSTDMHYVIALDNDTPDENALIYDLNTPN